MNTLHITPSRRMDFLKALSLTLVLLCCITSCDRNRKELITERTEKYLSDSLKQKVIIVSVDSINTWNFDKFIASTKSEIDSLRQNQKNLDDAVRLATKSYNLEIGNFIIEVYRQAKPMLQKDMDEINQHYENMYKHKDLALTTYKVTYRLESDNTYELFVTSDKDYKTFSYQKENTLGSLTDDFPAVFEFVDNMTNCSLKRSLLNDKHQKLLLLLTNPSQFLQ